MNFIYTYSYILTDCFSDQWNWDIRCKDEFYTFSLSQSGELIFLFLPPARGISQLLYKSNKLKVRDSNILIDLNINLLLTHLTCYNWESPPMTASRKLLRNVLLQLCCSAPGAAWLVQTISCCSTCPAVSCSTVRILLARSMSLLATQTSGRYRLDCKINIRW